MYKCFVIRIVFSIFVFQNETNMKQTLRNLIADGKTAKAIAELRRLTTSDPDLNTEINLIANRFATFERQLRLGLEDPSVLNIESNKINTALLDIIDRLSASEAVPSSHRLTTAHNIKFTIAILAGLVVIITFVFKYCLHISDGGDGKPFSVVVYTHGIGGRQDILQLKETKLVADFGGRRDVATVGEHGQNTFNEVPAAFRNKRIGIGLQGTEGYALTYNDSTYLLNGEPIYLAVQSSCRFCKVAGIVRNQNTFIPNAIVNTGQYVDTTDANGYFEINIPPNKEQSEYPVTVRVKGKIVWDKFITPNPKQPAEILIEK